VLALGEWKLREALASVFRRRCHRRIRRIPVAKLLAFTTVRQRNSIWARWRRIRLVRRLQPGGPEVSGQKHELKFEIMERSSV